ncbi:MAG: ABC transporter permease [Dehalococcoidia bacterium]
MTRSLSNLKQLSCHPSLVVGLVLIAILVGMSLYAVIAIPYSEAIGLWRDPGERVENPKFARPVWFDLLTSDRLPRTIIVSSHDAGIVRIESLDDNRELYEVVLPFSYQYDAFPSELTLSTLVTGGEERTPVSVAWETETGDTILLGEYHARQSHTYYISQDGDLRDRLGMAPHRGLFADLHDAGRMLKGDYRLVLRAEVPRDAEVEVRLVVYGQVHGPFGTDHMRRDLTVPMVWGAVVALWFGILAALAFQLGNLLLALMGRRYRERVDPLFLRLTDVNTILLLLPILIVISHLYQLRIWVILASAIVLSGGMAVIKVLRAVFLPSVEVPHSGPAPASRAVMALLLPSFLLTVPAFVFLEAALGLFGLGDPFLPTWGNVLYDAFVQSALYHGHYYWILQPLLLLMVLGIGFAMAGYALHRIYNPRLQTER